MPMSSTLIKHAKYTFPLNFTRQAARTAPARAIKENDAQGNALMCYLHNLGCYACFPMPCYTDSHH